MLPGRQAGQEQQNYWRNINSGWQPGLCWQRSCPWGWCLGLRWSHGKGHSTACAGPPPDPWPAELLWVLWGPDALCQKHSRTCRGTAGGESEQSSGSQVSEKLHREPGKTWCLKCQETTALPENTSIIRALPDALYSQCSAAGWFRTLLHILCLCCRAVWGHCGSTQGLHASPASGQQPAILTSAACKSSQQHWENSLEPLLPQCQAAGTEQTA